MALVDLAQYGLPSEPTVGKWQQGVDLLFRTWLHLVELARVIVGKEWIAQLQAHPLKRVLRCSKVNLLGLEATFSLYLWKN